MICTFHGSDKSCGGPVEQHHVAGRNHVPWLTFPLCRKHHALMTRALQHAGVDMRHTDDKIERMMRAAAATQIFQWWLMARLREELQK